MKPLRLAVVGVGHLGRSHARILSTLEGVSLVGVVDPAEVPCREVAAACRTQACADFRQLLGQIDAAVVATPTRFHAQVALPLINAGVHLLVEKPLAPSADDAAALVATARQRGVVLQVGHVERFNPAWNAVAADLQQAKFIEASRLSAFKFRSTDIGVVLDLMIHDIDLVLATVRSPVERIDALGLALFGRHEDVAHARIEFADGCVAVLRASRASYTAERSIQVWTPRGFAAIDLAARRAHVVHPSEAITSRHFDAERLTADERAEWLEHLFERHLPISEVQPPAVDQLTAELEDFRDSIQQGRAPRVTGQQALDALRLAERILESIAAHRWDGVEDGRVGPQAAPRRSALRGPHWHRRAARRSAESSPPAARPDEHRRAG